MAVEVKNISLSFSAAKSSRDKIFEDFNLDIKDGEFTCFLGPSGCGKSTLLGMIAGFVKPEKGEILVREKKVLRPDINRTLVFQEYALFPWLNVIDNVAFGLENTVKDKQERNLQAARYLKMVGLLKHARQNVNGLSGGMKQRVALARALVVKPDLLLMDEPFAALDAQTRNSMRKELIRIWSEINSGNYKQSVIFVTHSVDEALLLSDRILVMGRNSETNNAVIKADIKIDVNRPRDLSSNLINSYRLDIQDALLDTKRDDGYIYDVGL